MITPTQILLALGTLAFFVILSYVLLYLLRKAVELTHKTESKLDDIIVKEIKKPLKIIIILTGFAAGLYYILPDWKVDGISLILVYKLAAIVAFSHLIVKAIGAALNWYIEEKIKISKATTVDYTLFQFLRKTSTIIVYIIALLMIFDTLGIKIGPILAGLGIAGLAVALALQDTLSNFFSSIYLTVDRPVKIGDYIELDSNYRGYVKEIGWRSTKLKTRDNNIIIIPNIKLSQSIVTNYHSHTSSLKIGIPIGISYNTDLEKAEKVIIDTTKEIIKKMDVCDKNHEPHVRYEQFADSSINLTINIYSKDYESQFEIKDKVIKEIHKAFKKHKIEIPYPQRVVYMRK